eukprot:Skav213865  [mRNA]  locus=scaffold2366:336381:344444:- [translate_table: standard]
MSCGRVRVNRLSVGCTTCGSLNYYNPNEPSKIHSPHGTWLYMPNGQPSTNSHSVATSSNNPRRRRRRGRHGQPPSGPPSSVSGREQAESEVPTNDPCVEPDHHSLGSHVSVRSQPLHGKVPPRDPHSHPRVPDHAHARSHPTTAPAHPQRLGTAVVANSEDKTILDALRRLVKGDGNQSSAQSWNSMMGPQKGVKYRGGTPPAPPKWDYKPNDVRAFDKFEKRVRLWQLHVSHHMSSTEASLALFTSLTGEAADQLEYADLQKVYSKTGVEYILDELRAAYQQKEIYIKRHHLFEYEHINRFPGEAIRTYLNRYRKAEAALMSIGVNITLTYDTEARGSRVLERAKLSPEQQRLVLVGTGQSLDFESVCSAMTMQYPEYKSPPPIFGKEGFRPDPRSGQKGGSRYGTTPSSSFPSTNGSTTASSSSSYRKGDGKQHGKARRVFQTIAENQNTDADGADDVEHMNDHAQDGDPPFDDDDDDADGKQDEQAEQSADDEMSQLANVLTVTAKKLAAMNQGRKYKNMPKKSIEQRKQESACAACGLVGHWAGDDSCPVSSKKGKGGRGKGGHGKASSPSDSKKVFTVNHYSGYQTFADFDAQEEQDQDPHHDVLVVFHTGSLASIENTEASSRSPGFMILDTACQRTCCGRQWFDSHHAILTENNLSIMYKDQTERFQFGAGEPLTSTHVTFFPVGIENHLCVLGTHVIDAKIPLLCSLSVMKKLALTIDIGEQTAIVGAFNNLKVPLVKMLGHLAICITNFPEDVQQKFSNTVIEHVLQSNETELITVDELPIIEAFDQGKPLGTPIASLPEPFGALGTPTSVPKPPADTLGTPNAPVPNPHGSWPSSLEPTFEGMASVHQAALASFQEHLGSTGSLMSHGLDHTRSLPPDDRPGLGQGLKTIPQTVQEQGTTKEQKLSKQQLSRSSTSSSSAQPSQQECHLQPSRLRPVRKRVGKLHEMQGVLHEVEVERRSRRLEVGWLLLQTIAFATIALDQGQVRHGSSVPYATGAIIDKTAIADTSNSLLGLTPQAVQTTINDILGGGSWTDSRGNAGVRLNDGRESVRSLPPVRDELKLGTRKRLNGDIRKNIKVLENEVFLIEALECKTPKPNKVDLLELYSGNGHPTKLCCEYGLNSLQPFESQDGYNLHDKEVKSWVTEAISRFNPLLLLIGFPWKEWCLMNENLNYLGKGRLDELNETRRRLRPHVKWIVKLCQDQINKGNLFFLESPPTSRFWEEPDVDRLKHHPDAYFGVCEGGAFDAKDCDGNPIIESFAFLTNSKFIFDMLSMRLTSEQRAQCEPLQGRDVTQSHEYPIKMVRALLKALKAEARARDPFRFQRVNQVLYAQPIPDEDAWREVLESVKKAFGSTSSKSILLREGHEIYTKVEALVPWKLTRVQAVSTPMIRRFPQDVGFTHRGAGLMFNDGTLEVESEDLSTLEFPKQKFSRPVAFGIIFYGYAEDDQPPKSTESVPDRFVPGLKTDVSYPGIAENIPKEVKASVARLHINAGHPSKQEMIRLFTMHGAINSSVLACLEHMQCGTCKRTQLPQQPRPASVPTLTGQFGDRLQLDRFWVRDLTGQNHCLLGLVDLATNYQQAVRIDGGGAAQVYHALQQLWFRPFGHPLMVETDDDGNFAGDFKEKIEGTGIHLHIVPAEAHWRIGTIERKNAILRNVMEKLIDERGATDSQMIDDILVASLQAINSSVTSKGRTPYQAVFGRLPRFPGDIFGDERALLANYDATYAEEMRAHALRVIAEMRASHTIRRALLRKTAASRSEAQQVLPGSMAAYWRWQKKAKGRKRGGYILGRLLSHDVDGKSAWLHNGNSVVQVTYEQMRPAFGLESWCPSSQDIAILKDGHSKIQQGIWEDERGPAPPLEESQDVDVEQLQQLPDALDLAPVPLPLIAPATPATAPATHVPPTPLPLHSHQHQQNTQANTTVYSPTYRQKNINIHQHFGPQRLRRHHEQAQPYPSTTVNDGEPQTQQLQVEEDELLAEQLQNMIPQTPPDIQQSPRQPAETIVIDDDPPQLSTGEQPMSHGASAQRDPHTGEASSKQPRNRDVLIATFDGNRLVQVELPPDGWDGRPIIELDKKCSVFRTAASEILGEPVSSDSSDDERRGGPSSLAKMTRQERKALDRELPWRLIMKMGKEAVEAFVEANIKEYKSWLSWGSIKPLSPEQIQEIKSSPVLRRRIIPARNAYRDKNRQVPPLKAKCRTVIVGCRDPDLHVLDRTSPTPSKHAEAIILQLAASGYNGRVQLQRKRWRLWAGDVSTAFLQGTPERRNLPIFMRSPRDGIQALAGSFPHELYAVEGNLYGFCNAPKTWTDHVTDTVMNKAKLKRHRLEHMMFYGLDEQGLLQVVCIIHVDDFLAVFREDYDESKLISHFQWGSQNFLTLDNPLNYRGKEIKLRKEGNLFVIDVTQCAFIDEMSTGKVSSARLKENPLLSKDEWSEYRSCAGSLQWLAGQTRPDISASVSLSNRGMETTVRELQQLYECIQNVKDTKNYGLVYFPVNLDRATHLVAYSDSSWANAHQHKSQMGILILLCSPGCLDGTVRASIMDWKSTRSPRVTRSTLASEANAMDEACDRCTYLNCFLTELLWDSSLHGQCLLTQLAVTDCRSLYDAVLSPNPVLSEKRTIITVRSIQEHVEPRHVRWTPTDVMWADSLTKVCADLIHRFQMWLRKPVCTLVDKKKIVPV